VNENSKLLFKWSLLLFSLFSSKDIEQALRKFCHPPKIHYGKWGWQNQTRTQRKSPVGIGDQKPFQQIEPEIVPFLKEHFQGFEFIHLIRHPFPVVRSATFFPADELLWKNMPEE